MDNQHNSLIYFLIILYNCYLSDIAVITALNRQLALDFISLNNALFDIISVCSNTEWHSPCGSAIAMAVSRTADSISSAVNVAY